MKYGETLRQRSAPAWSHHNIDYDDIKLFIKDETTPGQGKSISVPGTVDERLLQFENALFHILASQHERIDLFVKSKAGEIRRRLAHSRRQLDQLAGRNTITLDQPIPVARLERYGRLENDLLKAGEEIKSLARFTAAQRTAFRKLLKKFKKWTGSTRLEQRFHEEITDDPKTFSHLDLGPMLDDYSHSLQSVRALYDDRIRQTRSLGTHHGAAVVPSAAQTDMTAVARLAAAVKTTSKVDFDTAVATVPLGNDGSIASYFVHPECIVELQMLLLSHCTYCQPRSRNNSVASPISPTSSTGTGQNLVVPPDYHTLVADDPVSCIQDYSALTFEDLEQRAGASPQRARIAATWTDDEEARIAFRTSVGHRKETTVKRKHLDALFSRSNEFRDKGDKTLQQLRRAYDNDERVRPLYRLSACRSRLVDVQNTENAVVLVTLDTAINIESLQPEPRPISAFPFAVLTIRQEGVTRSPLTVALDQSHLVERVRGFSMEYHAVWTACPQIGGSTPPWAPLLSRDIRKLPPPAIKERRSRSGSHSANTSNGSPSDRGGTDSVTAVETTGEGSHSNLTIPPLRAFRKKRRRAYPAVDVPAAPQQRYWSEYDHPEDGEADGADAYVIYVDPNEKGLFERFLEKFEAFFGKSTDDSSPSTPVDDQSGSDTDEDDAEEATALIPRTARRQDRSGYGAVAFPAANLDSEGAYVSDISFVGLPHTTIICYISSLTILTVAYFLAYAGKHKYHYAVDAGILLAVLFSVIFAVFGFVVVCRRNEIIRRAGAPNDWTSYVLASTVLLVDTIAAGGLLAWVLSFGGL